MRIDNSLRVVRAGLFGGVATLAIVAMQRSTLAGDFKQGDVTYTVDGIATVGTSIRTTGPNPNYIATNDATVAGVPAGVTNNGHNQDDGNLNFAKGRPVSTVAKGLLTLGASDGSVGFRVQGSAWYDYTLENGSVPYGSTAGGYAPGKLSDGGFENAAKFASVKLMDAYIFGQSKIGDVTASGRLGNQVISWGSQTAIPGGLFSMINATDLNAAYRPGALPDEVVQRMPAAYGKLDVTKNFGLEGFYQLANTHTSIPGCGTFYSNNDYAADGCNKVFVVPKGALSDPTATTQGLFVGRSADAVNHDQQFGLGASYLFDPIATKAGLWYAHVDGHSPIASSVSSNVPVNGTLFVPFSPKNGTYFMEYAPNIEVVTANFTTKLKTTTISGEATFKHNAPLLLASGDVQNAFVSSVAASPLRADQIATGPNAVFHSYDEKDQGYFDLKVTQQLPGLFGAAGMIVNGDVALKSVYGLPDPNIRRYGRNDVFGANSFTGTAFPSPVCSVTTAPAIQCTTAGYTTANAWGYRLNVAMKYDDVFTTGLSITPSVGIAQDVSGWSNDGGFSQGRVVMNLGMRTDYKNTFATVGWNPQLASGTYDNTSDRQVVTMAAGVKF